MGEKVSKITLDVNSQKITSFRSFTEDERVLREDIELMDEVGWVESTANYGGKLEYVIPKNEPEFDFDSVANGTLTIDRQNSTRILYTGVRTKKVGETKYEKGQAAGYTVEFGASGRTVE